MEAKSSIPKQHNWTTLPALALALAVAGALVSSSGGHSQGQQPNRQLTHGPTQKPKTTSERRTALIIGNGAYENASRLANPTNDAEDLATALRELGFELVGDRAHLNQKADQMKRLIKQFGEKIADGGVGLFYYAGHGLQSQGHNYLVPTEANIMREKTLEFEAVDVNRVLAEMDAAGNGFNIVILDACRNSPFTRSWRSTEQGLAQLNAPEGTLIAYATSPGRVASDGAGRNGAYTAELLRLVRVPSLTIEEMFKAVRAGVKRATDNQQTPWEASSLVGQFCFSGACGVSGNSSAVSAMGAPRSISESAKEEALWNAVKDSDDAQDFRDYIAKYPNGAFVDAARVRIRRLEPVKTGNATSNAQSTDQKIELVNPVMLKALEKFRDSNYTEALELFKKVTELDRNNWLAYYGTGLTLANLGRWREAIEPLRRVFQLNPHPQWANITEKMIRELLAEVEQNAKITR